jgi:N-alpha-acetyltransferase 30
MWCVAKSQRKMAAMVEAAISPSLDSDHSSTSSSLPTIEYLDYTNESNLTEIQALVSKDLSEPYSIFTYRYFLHNWPNLCICAYSSSPEKPQKEMIGTIVCKADLEYGVMKGYIAMLTVNNLYRKQGIGSYLAQLGIQRMINAGCLEIVLETEVSNKGASSLYEKLGFLREERLARSPLLFHPSPSLSLSLSLTTAQVLSQWRRCLPSEAYNPNSCSHSRGDVE